MSFNEQLSKLRKRNNITQIDLANQMNVKQYVISSWETGRSEPNISQILKLCDILAVPADYLLDRPIINVSSVEDFDKVVQNIDKDIKEDFLKDVKELCKDFNDSKKQKVVNIIKELTKLMQVINILNFDDNYEFTFECNPESITEEKLSLLKSNGVNNLRLGIAYIVKDDDNLIGLFRLDKKKNQS